MSAAQGFLRRLRSLLLRRRTDAELAEELRFHLDLETEKNAAAGMSEPEARRRALVSFGGVTQTMESHREVGGGRWIADATSDARHALRSLARNPVLGGAAILTLALGIGANTAIFSAVNAVILRPLPFLHPERLVMLSEDNPEKGWVREYSAPANFLDWRERVKSFEDVASYTGGGGATLIIDGRPTRIRGRAVSGNYFSVLGRTPEMGRGFEWRETWKGSDVAIISHRFWLDAFGGDRNVVGRTVSLDGTPTQIVGVMPQSFSFAADTMDLWQTFAWDQASRSRISFRRAHFLRTIARLKPGVTPEAANAEFQTVVKRLQTEYPQTNRVMGADMVPLHDYLIGDIKPALLILQGAVALLLLIACANVGNLMLVQALGRERETSLRLTLGARSARLVRQALTESLVLSALGGVAGLALGWWGTRGLAALQPNGMLPVGDVTMDWRVLLAIFGLTTLTGLLFGIVPAVWASHREPADVLREGGRGGASRRVRRWGDVMVAAEVALALTLTLGAGLLVRSFWRLAHVDPGFEPRGVLATGISLGAGYDSASTQLHFFEGLLEEVRATPGVTDAAAALVPPLGGYGFSSDYHIGGRGPDDYGTEIGREQVTPHYFETLRVPLVAGRFITEADREKSLPVVVINEALARKEFHGVSPIGQTITFDQHPDSTAVWRTIVGVVGNIHESGLALDPKITAYEAVAQSPNSGMTLLVRTSGDVRALVPAIRRLVAARDPALALAQTQPLASLEARSIARQRFIMSLIVVFAATGFLLAVIGVYGVMAQTTRRRTREMGIRLALGARTADVQWLVMRHAFGVVAVGLVLGVAAALGGGRIIRGLLYDVAPTDPLTFIVIPALILTTGLLASWLPALRASRTAPSSTLREE